MLVWSSALEPGASSAKKPSRMNWPPSVPAIVASRPLARRSTPKTIAKGRPSAVASRTEVDCRGVLSSLWKGGEGREGEGEREGGEGGGVERAEVGEQFPSASLAASAAGHAPGHRSMGPIDRTAQNFSAIALH